MAPPRTPAAQRCFLRALCGGVLWAILATEVIVASSEEQQSLASSGAKRNEPAPAVASDSRAASQKTAKADESSASPKKDSEIAGLQAELAKVKSELSTAKAEISRLEKVQGDNAANAAAESGKVAQKETTITDLNAQIDSLTNEKSKQAEDLKRVSEENTELKSTIQKQTEDQATVKEELSQKEVTLTATQKDLDQAREDLTQSQKQEEQLRADVKAAQEKEEQLQADVKAASEKAEQLQADLKTSEDKGEQLQADLKTSQGKEKERQADLKELQAKMDMLNAAHDSVKEELAKSKNTVLTLSAEKDEKHKMFEDERTNHKKLRSEHEDLEAKYADPSVQHFLQAKAVKVYKDPGVEGAANKTFIYVVPTLKDRYFKGKRFVDQSESAVYTKLNAYVGTEKMEPWLPIISGSLVYGAIIIPFVFTMCCLTRIVCKFRTLLLFFHLDFLVTALCAGCFALYTGKEPLAAFAHHDASVYLFTQIIFGLAFCVYFLLLCFGYCWSKGGTLEGVYRFCQLIGAIPPLGVYYKNVWTPAMLDKMPHMDELVKWAVGEGAAVSDYAWLPYLPASVLFLLLLRLERLCWHASGIGSTKAGQDQISVKMRDDLELATLYGEGQGTADSATSSADKMA